MSREESMHQKMVREHREQSFAERQMEERWAQAVLDRRDLLEASEADHREVTRLEQLAADLELTLANLRTDYASLKITRDQVVAENARLEQRVKEAKDLMVIIEDLRHAGAIVVREINRVHKIVADDECGMCAETWPCETYKIVNDNLDAE